MSDIELLKEVWGTIFENRYNLTEDGEEFDPDDLLKRFGDFIKSHKSTNQHIERLEAAVSNMIEYAENALSGEHAFEWEMEKIVRDGEAALETEENDGG